MTCWPPRYAILFHFPSFSVLYPSTCAGLFSLPWTLAYRTWASARLRWYVIIMADSTGITPGLALCEPRDALSIDMAGLEFIECSMKQGLNSAPRMFHVCMCYFYVLNTQSTGGPGPVCLAADHVGAGLPPAVPRISRRVERESLGT